MKEPIVLFDYSCGICNKHTNGNGYKRFPVVFKPTMEKILVCETCLDFIKEHGSFSSFEVVKK